MDSINTKTELPELAMNHLWCVSYHLVELFKVLLPEENNHITMAVSTATIMKILNELDTDLRWSVWPSDIKDEDK